MALIIRVLLTYLKNIIRVLYLYLHVYFCLVSNLQKSFILTHFVDFEIIERGVTCKTSEN